MTATSAALLGFAAWTMVLLVSLGGLRTAAVLTKARAANSFSPSGDDMSDFGKRLTRAHANCYEFLPIAGVVMLYAIATGQTGATDGFAYIFLAARIAQSVTHMISTSNLFVQIRFAFFLVQILILAAWILKLFAAG